MIVIAIMILGAVASTGGRYVWAHGARLFQDRLRGRLKSNLAVARERLRGTKRLIFEFANFLVSPLPSAQLFVAVGLLNLPLALLIIAFFVVRSVKYSLYVSVATLADNQLSSVINNSFGSLWSIVIQVVLLVAVCALPFVNWECRPKS